MLCLTPAIRQIRPGAGVCKGGRPRRPGAGRRCRLPHEGVVQTMPSSRPTSSHRSSRRFCACIMMPGKRAAGGRAPVGRRRRGSPHGLIYNARRDGPPRIVAREPGQVRKEAAITGFRKCRGLGSSPRIFRGRNASSFLLRSFAARVVVFLSHPVIRRGSWFPGASRPSPFRFRRHGGAMHRENIASVSCLSGVLLRLKPGASTIPPSGTGPQVAAA